MLLRVIPIIAIMLLLASCCKQVTPIIYQTTDSTRIEVRERIVKVRDTIFVPVPEQSTTQIVRDSISHLETDFAISDARIMPDGSLSHSLKNKTQNILFETENEIHYRDSIVEKEKEVPVPVPVEKELTWWGKIKQLLGGIAIGAIIIYISAKIIAYKFRV